MAPRWGEGKKSWGITMYNNYFHVVRTGQKSKFGQGPRRKRFHVHSRTEALEELPHCTR